MKKIISLISAALALAACSTPTAPSADRSTDVAKARTALGAAEKVNGKLTAN